MMQIKQKIHWHHSNASVERKLNQEMKKYRQEKAEQNKTVQKGKSDSSNKYIQDEKVIPFVELIEMLFLLKNEIIKLFPIIILNY